MGFSETLKEEVKKAAAFTCIWCRRYDVALHVHHILPSEWGGGDDFDNAVPLCPTCHYTSGHNPDLRKEIRDRRDWWYEQCKSRENIPVFNPETTEKITQQVIEAIRQQNKEMFEELKEDLKSTIRTSLPYFIGDTRTWIERLSDKLIPIIDNDTAVVMTSALFSATTATIIAEDYRLPKGVLLGSEEEKDKEEK